MSERAFTNLRADWIRQRLLLGLASEMVTDLVAENRRLTVRAGLRESELDGMSKKLARAQREIRRLSNLETTGE